LITEQYSISHWTTVVNYCWTKRLWHYVDCHGLYLSLLHFLCQKQR